jgi:hypothetical protein
VLFHATADVDDVVGDDAEPDPTVHSDVAFVAATAGTVSPLDHADAPLASGALFLAVAEPALFLLAFALSGVGSERAVSGTSAKRLGQGDEARHPPQILRMTAVALICLGLRIHACWSDNIDCVNDVIRAQATGNNYGNSHALNYLSIQFPAVCRAQRTDL